MKVTIVCNSDSNGGAALVTKRLLTALRREGVEARMLVYNKLSTDPDIYPIGSVSLRSLTFIKERAKIFLNNGFSRKNLFKVSTADSGIDISGHPLIKDADIILLSWINQGVLSLKDIHKLGRTGKPIVWMMHDMWNLTGICHHAHSCEGYRHKCGACPLLGSVNPGDLSHRVWERKRKLYSEVPISFVAVSTWLANKCRKSSLMRDRDVTVIPNPFHVDAFSIQPHNDLSLSTLDYSKDMIVMGAARLDDPIKGLDIAIDALNDIFINHPELSRTTTAVFFGSVKDSSVFDRLRFPFRHLGRINDRKVVREIYSAAKVVISTSLYETLPSTLIEGQASGCIPVSFDKGGQRDIVEHLKTGYLAEYCNPKSVAEGILWALGHGNGGNPPVSPEILHQNVRNKFSAAVVAREYIKLFERLLEKKRDTNTKQ